MKALILFSFFYCVSTVPVPKSSTTITSEYVDLTEVKYENGSEVISVKLTAFQKKLQFRLKKLPDIFTDQLKIISLKNNYDGKISVQQTISKNDRPMTYGEITDQRRTIVHLHRRGKQITIEGILSHDITIHPIKNPISDKKSHIVIKKEKDLIRKRRYSGLSFDESLNNANKYVDEDLSVSTVFPLPSLIQPEVFVVVDYKNAKAMEFDDQRIINYLSIFWHGVNSRYAVAENPKIQLVIVSILIIKDVNHQTFIEKNRVTFEGQDLIQDEMTQHDVGQYFYELFNKTLTFDLAVLMTGEDLADKTGEGDSTVWHPDVQGLADVAGACKINSYYEMFDNFAVAEDIMPFYTGVFTHVHEIGHLLGAVHDGEGPQPFLRGHPGARECPFKDGYLMSYYFGTINHHFWSKCSLEQFRWKIQDSSGICLRDAASEPEIPENSVLPGEEISLTDQCKALVGSEGQVYKDEENKSPCVHLRCTINQRTWESAGPALEGSACDKNKWCLNGECVTKG